MSNVKKEKAHAKFGASKSERWLNCAASVQLEAKMPEQARNQYAESGTRTHECLETFLKQPTGNVNKISAFLLKQGYDADQIGRASRAAGRILDDWNPQHQILLCETEVRLDFIEKDEFGTVDAALVEEFGDLIVYDYKDGEGVHVYPEDNSQCIYYALGLCHKYNYNFQRVKIRIIQRDEPTREWVTTPDNLVLWAKKFEKGIALAKSKNPPFKANPDGWCRWCRAKAICPELSKKALAQAKIVFDDMVPEKVELPDPKSVPVPRLGEVLEAAEKIELWIAGLRAYAEDRLQKGQPVKGWKLVNKNSIRKWLDASKAAKEAKKKFGDAAFDVDLKSPKQLEESTGDKEWVAKRVSSVSSGLTMVPESDKRDAVNPIEKAFGDKKCMTSKRAKGS